SPRRPRKGRHLRGGLTHELHGPGVCITRAEGARAVSSPPTPPWKWRPPMVDMTVVASYLDAVPFALADLASLCWHIGAAGWPRRAPAHPGATKDPAPGLDPGLARFSPRGRRSGAPP